MPKIPKSKRITRRKRNSITDTSRKRKKVEENVKKSPEKVYNGGQSPVTIDFEKIERTAGKRTIYKRSTTFYIQNCSQTKKKAKNEENYIQSPSKKTYSVEWWTPLTVLSYVSFLCEMLFKDKIHADLAATVESTTCSLFYEEKDGFPNLIMENEKLQNWINGFLNPPFIDLENWIFLCRNLSQKHNKNIICLLSFDKIHTNIKMLKQSSSHIIKLFTNDGINNGKLWFIKDGKTYVREAPFKACLVIFTKQTLPENLPKRHSFFNNNLNKNTVDSILGSVLSRKNFRFS